MGNRQHGSINTFKPRVTWLHQIYTLIGIYFERSAHNVSNAAGGMNMAIGLRARRKGHGI